MSSMINSYVCPVFIKESVTVKVYGTAVCSLNTSIRIHAFQVVSDTLCADIRIKYPGGSQADSSDVMVVYP